MAFNGIFPAGELVQAPCGLLSVATVVNHTTRPDDQRWISGYEVEATGPSAVRIISSTGDDFAEGELSDTHGVPTHFPVVPFFIEVEVKTSGMGLIQGDPLGGINAKIEAATQKAVERELWEGLSAQHDANDNIFLRAAGGAAILAGGAAVTPKRGIALLEQAISNSPTGGAGTLHMTRDVAASTLTGLTYVADPADMKDGAVFTNLGTPVVVGSGYTGNGPIGATGAAASDTNKWVYVTGPVTVHLGTPERVNENLGQGFNPATNDGTAKALRPAAVHFDSTIYYAVRVTLPEMP
jgi:hypothetical protein